MVNTNYNTTEVMINIIERLRGKTKLKFNQNVSNYYDEMNYRRQSGIFKFEEDTFSKNMEGIGKIYNEVFLFRKFLQTKPQVKSLNTKYDDL